MSDCTLIREQMPLLLTESLGSAGREAAHQHIEACASCETEWSKTRETWKLLAEAADRPVPTRVRARFLDEAASMGGAMSRRPVVVPFTRKPVFRRLAQAAAIAVIAGGAYFAGSTRGTTPATGTGMIASASPAPQFRISENARLSADQIAPEIAGSPAISNVRFIDHEGRPGEVGMTFDLTQKVTVTGKATDQSLVNLAAYVLGDSDHPTTSRSNAIQWVRDTYSTGQTADPQIVTALSGVLRNDAHEGVRLKAVETLGSLPAASLGGAAAQARQALIDALQNDPNTNVRLKAVEALANLAAVPDGFDPAAVETLRKKASQNDENPYLRVKAAEALSQMNL
ncbi:MAG: HEAT repeat domain-containing protein [Acidobacteria bacterium]|nr:HEAT repeat domain-containing protein [Acidobacteriota bacterium]